MKKQSAILFILLVVPVLLVAQVPSNPDSSAINNWKMTGSILLQTGHYPESVFYLDSVLDASPFDRDARFNESRGLLPNGELQLIET